MNFLKKRVLHCHVIANPSNMSIANAYFTFIFVKVISRALKN